MDSSLARVIIEMRNEIQKLETENKALRGALDQRPSGSDKWEPSSESSAFQQAQNQPEDNSPQSSLRRNVSAPALEGQYQENIIMTVRRYSISSNIQNGPRRGNFAQRVQAGTECLRPSTAKRDRLEEGVHGSAPAVLVNLTRGDNNDLTKEKLNKRSLQDYVHKNRAKVKTVTFLLPVDDIYTARPALSNRLTDRTSYNGDVTVEKDL